MATVKFQLLGKSNPSPIYVRLVISKKQDYRRKTGLKINPDDWGAKGLPKQNNNAFNKKITLRLKALENKLLEDLNEAIVEDQNINGEWLTFRIDLFFERISITKKSELLIDAVDEVITTASTKQNAHGGIGLSQSRIKSYEGLKSILEKYCGNRKIKVKEVNVNFANEFLHWLISDEKYGKSFALKTIDNLKAVCKDADLKGIKISSQLSNIKGGRIKNDNIIYLTPNELEIIKNKELDNPKLENVRKWLLLGCCIGQRGGDLLNLTKDNFKIVRNLNVIELEQQKTGKLILIPVNQQVKNIIDSGFPYKISSQKFNEYIKALCEICEIDTPTKGSVYKLDENKVKRKKEGVYPKYELITSHVCRRSFCSNYYGKMPTNLIMQISGHSTEKMLLNYIGKKSPDYLQEIAHYFALEEQKNQKVTQMNIVKDIANG